MTIKDNVIQLRPADSFKHVVECAAEEIVVGLVIGYDADGQLTLYSGGKIKVAPLNASNALFLVEEFKHNLMSGHYATTSED